MIAKINRIARSIISLNRKIEYETIVSMLNLDDRDNLLDVGSGDGFWTYKFSFLVNDVTGIDPSDHLLSLAKKHYRNQNLLFDYGEAEKLKFGDCTFSKVTSISTVEHFQNPIKGIEEMTRVLKKDGIISISVDSLNFKNCSEKFMNWHKEKHYVSRYFSKRDIIDILRRYDIEVDKEEIVGIFTSKLSCYLRSIFIRNTKLLLLLFPIFYYLCRLVDNLSIGGTVPPQILIVKGKKL